MISSTGQEFKTRITSDSKFFKRLIPQLVELWEYRELIFFLGWKDVMSRYGRTSLGFIWVIVQPLSSLVVLSLVMGKLMKVSSDGFPYPVFAFIGILCWQYLMSTASATQLPGLAAGRLLTKVYFPPLTIPISILVLPFVDFLFGSIVLVGMMVLWHCQLSVNIVWLPLFLGLEILIALVISLWFMALTIAFHDMRHVLPILMQLLYLASPVFYSSSVVPKNFAVLYDLNPIACVIQGFRWSILGAGQPPFAAMIPGTCVLIVLLCLGFTLYDFVSRKVADII
ncbi:MAG: ABC transporter permease [Candidatus Obscuribacterales bacterium]|nr:ABC transporter permease [Candidatus Obscuribacterales bacterium]